MFAPLGEENATKPALIKARASYSPSVRKTISFLPIDWPEGNKLLAAPLAVKFLPSTDLHLIASSSVYRNPILSTLEEMDV